MAQNSLQSPLGRLLVPLFSVAPRPGFACRLPPKPHFWPVHKPPGCHCGRPTFSREPEASGESPHRGLNHCGRRPK